MLPSLQPELVLLDVRMPGLNGPETSRLIRASGARSVVVLVSALSRPELPDSVEQCGAAAILHKCELSPRRLVTLWQDLHSQHAGPKAGAPGRQRQRALAGPRPPREGGGPSFGAPPGPGVNG